MKFSMIVFDVDGTIFDTKEGIIMALNSILSELGRNKIGHDVENLYIGPPLKESLIKYQGMETKIAEDAVSRFRVNYTEKYILQTVLYDGIKDVFEYLASIDAVLGIATNKPEVQVKKLLKLFDVEKFFSVIECPDLKKNEIKSEMLRHIKKLYPCATDYIMIGDTVRDYEAAKKNNFVFIGADYGYGDINGLDIIHAAKARELIEQINLVIKQTRL